MTVPTDVYEALSATPDDLDGLVDYPREIQGVEVGVLFRETAKGSTKVSFRSNGEVDVNALARQFGGGGHMKAAGALVERPLNEVRVEVLEATRAAIRSGSDRRGRNLSAASPFPDSPVPRRGWPGPAVESVNGSMWNASTESGSFLPSSEAGESGAWLP